MSSCRGVFVQSAGHNLWTDNVYVTKTGFGGIKVGVYVFSFPAAGWRTTGVKVKFVCHGDENLLPSLDFLLSSGHYFSRHYIKLNSILAY